MSQIQVSAFTPRSIYDAPETLFSMAIDGELTLNGARSAIFAPETLTPVEMEGFKERLKKAAGSHAVSDALIDVVTNPWAWLFVLSGPAGEGAGKALYKVAREISPRVREQAPLLATLGMLGPRQVLRDTPVGAVITRFEQGLRHMMGKKELGRFDEALDQVIQKNGLSEKYGLDWQRYAPGEQQDKARLIGTALQFALQGEQRAGRVERFTKWNKKKGGLYTHDISLGRRVLTDPNEVLGRFVGGMELRDATRETMRSQVEEVLGTPEKVLKVWRGLQNSLVAPEGNVAGVELVKGVLGELAEATKMGSVSKETFLKRVQETVVDPMRSNEGVYFPRNLVETVLNGKPVTNPVPSRWAVGVKPSGSVVGRVAKSPLWHPEDYAFVNRTMGLAPEGITEWTKAIEASQSGKAVKFMRVNPQRSLRKYFDGMARNYAMFAQEVGDEVRAMNKATRANVVDEEMRYAGGAGTVKKSIEELEAAGEVPIGGFSLADVLAAEHEVLVSPYARKTLEQVAVPHMMGQLRTDHAALLAGLHKAKDVVGWVAETSVGEAIRKAGPFGEKLVEGMKRWSSQPVELQDARDVTRGLTKTLYSSHIGLNGSTAAINLMQPLGQASAWLGVNNVMKGYAAAIQEMGSYIASRAREGFKPLTLAEKDARIRKYFSVADEAGISPDMLEQVEGVTFSLEKARRSIPGIMERVLFEYPMKMFEKTEWLNKAVVAHANRARWKAAGRDVRTPEFLNETRQVIQDTQFGGHWFDQPLAFLPGNQGLAPTGALLTNPAMRMFSSFALRSFTSFAHTGTQLYGRQGTERLTGTIRDALRGIGLSAIVYELGKNLLGVDLERGGYVSAITEAIPGVSGGRYDLQGEAINLPPVLDIPVQLGKALVGGDAELLERTIPRLFPGGIAISRAFQIAPRLGLPDPFNMQQTYVDWANPDAQGRVAVYKGDRSLIDWRDKTDLVLKGLGVDLGRWSAPGSAANHVSKNVDLIRELRRQAAVALVTNDQDRFAKVKREFEKRIGLPLTLSRNQLKAQQEVLARPRLDRIVNRAPEEYRMPLQRQVQATREWAGYGPQEEEPTPETAFRSLGRP